MVLTKEAKRDIVAVLKAAGVLQCSDFTGKVIVNLIQGGVQDIEKSERIK
jgi:hypothetical protein